ncbi:MAG: hypothetical protein BGO78_12775 [Chloroflexi bacterium 44-23]|nr:MAG: hypothetical protein BGO78_12775 [Chloroflexi bacterium 44-23]
MKVSGHTLGTPNMFLSNALRLFRAAGLDGAEIIWQNDYPSGISESASDQSVKEVRTLATTLGLEICCLTPYMTNINSLDDQERDRDIERFKRCILTAEQLGSQCIRVYAGSYMPGEENIREQKWVRLVESLQFLGEIGARTGVTLCVENHFNTMTVSALETASLMKEVDSPGVGILYDQANLVFTYNEDFPEAIELQKEWIKHVHVKDLIFTKKEKVFKAGSVARVDDDENRAVQSRVVGTGVLDWPNILADLKNRCEYSGYLSVEYEYRWHPNDLPKPEDGFKQSNDYLETILVGLQKEK